MRAKITIDEEAFSAAKSEGLRYFWASRHVGGTSAFVGHSWHEGGFLIDLDRNPTHDFHGNTVAGYKVEELDRSNPAHVAQCLEWWGGLGD